jgi:enoyl-CoA hydratase/carnithine racemase
MEVIRVIELTRHDAVYVLHMRAEENRFGPEFLAAIGNALDEVERAEGAAALVTTGAGKFYSNGLDLDSLAGKSGDEIACYLRSVLGLFARILAFPRITVAAINGHAFAGGGMLALAHDFRVMRSDRGYFCLPESDLRLPLQPGMTALIHARLPSQTAHEAIMTGRRYGGADALAHGIVDHAVAETDLLPRAIAIAQELSGKHAATLAALKTGLYAETLRTLRGDAT